MANVNVNRSVTDQFYRYKMPRIIAKVEGKGNGIKTVIVNMTEVAKALSRPPTYPTKFFGCELGAQTQFDMKNERFIVNGAHDAAKLQDLLDGFIKKFVLCPECDNPETNLHVQVKKGTISQRCIACGHQCMTDMRHKLTTYILKNPPDQDPASTPSKKDKKAKSKAKKDAVNGDASPDGRNSHDSDEAPSHDVEEPPKKTRQHSKKNKREDEDEWGEDTSAEAVQQRMEALSSAAKNLALTDELEKTQQERINILYELIKRHKLDGSLASADKEIVAEAERLDIKEKAPLILVEVLFDQNILQQIKLYRPHFLRFTHNNPKAQKYLLGGLEMLVGNVHREVLMPKVAHILKSLYDNDILDEEVIIDWDKKVSKKYVSKEVAKEIHEKAQVIIKWLKEAEEDSDEEDEDDSEEEEEEEEDVEVVYSNTEKAGTVTVVNTKPAGHQEEEDDIDIDAI